MLYNRFAHRQAQFDLLRRGIFQHACKFNRKAVIAVGVFVGTLLSPVLGDEVAGAGALSNAWAAVKSIGLSQSALAVFQGLTMQFGYVLP